MERILVMLRTVNVATMMGDTRVNVYQALTTLAALAVNPAEIVRHVERASTRNFSVKLVVRIVRCAQHRLTRKCNLAQLQQTERADVVMAS